MSNVDMDLQTVLGLGDAVLIDRNEYTRLPEHRRTIVSSSSASGGYAYLRLADPAPVAALRNVLMLATDAGVDDSAARDTIAEEAREALAEFDGASS